MLKEYFLSLIDYPNNNTDISYQQKYYKWIAENSKIVQVSVLREILSEDKIEKILQKVKPEPKACFKNAARLAKFFPEFHYVEGYKSILGAMATEHAWNRIGEHYVDITIEYAIFKNPSEDEYLMVKEYPLEDLLAYNKTKSDWYDSKINLEYRQNKLF